MLMALDISLRYHLSSVVCHTDTSFMPSSQSKWRCLNFAKAYPLSPSEHAHQLPPPPQQTRVYNVNDVAMCTHWANKSQPDLAYNIFQSTNPILCPMAEKVLSTSWFERCFVTLDSMMALDDLNRLQGSDCCWFIGSYAWPGIPLLEGCVESALAAARGIGRERGILIKSCFDA